MARKNDKLLKQSAKVQAQLKRRALTGFYRFAKNYISKDASQSNNHICLGNNPRLFNTLRNTPILKSPKYNDLSVEIADMYPSDIEFYCNLDCDFSDEEETVEVKHNTRYDDSIEKSLNKMNPITNANLFEVTTEDYNPEDGNDDEDLNFTDSRNEYNIDSIKPSASTIIRPKQKHRNSSNIRTKEYMDKYNDRDTWIDLFL